MSISISRDALLERVSAGERLSAADIHDLAATPDILSIGMLADVLRRRLHDTRTTFLRVAECALEAPALEPAEVKAQEIRITGSPVQLADAMRAVEVIKSKGNRTVSAFTWSDVERMASGASIAAVLKQLRGAGLDSVSVLPLDGQVDPALIVNELAAAGFTELRLTVDKAPADSRAGLLLRAAELQDRVGCIQAISPLPMTLSTFRPTTGYDDVKMVAIARLAAPNIPSVQVDWRRYGPKLAQVALTFGADDIDGVSASDEAPEGRRRAPLEEITRNIQAAGFEPVERTGRFTAIA
jgi:aminodeoxyfutalosine synthase